MHTKIELSSKIHFCEKKIKQNKMRKIPGMKPFVFFKRPYTTTLCISSRFVQMRRKTGERMKCNI